MDGESGYVLKLRYPETGWGRQVRVPDNLGYQSSEEGVGGILGGDVGGVFSPGEILAERMLSSEEAGGDMYWGAFPAKTLAGKNSVHVSGDVSGDVYFQGDAGRDDVLHEGCWWGCWQG